MQNLSQLWTLEALYERERELALAARVHALSPEGLTHWRELREAIEALTVPIQRAA